MDSVATPSDLLAHLRQFRLLSPDAESEIAHHVGEYSAADQLAVDLQARGWLTSYQVRQALAGKASELVLGSYILLEPLGEGGMGSVYLGRPSDDDQRVAIKVMHKARSAKQSAVKRFRREIHVAKQLDHPNIVRALDVGSAHGVPFFVMEYVAGWDLDRHVRSHGVLPVGVAVDYIRQAALGLQHAMEKGVVHRDIKPQNLLLTADHTVKILDFGLVRIDRATNDDLSGTLTKPGSAMGTPDYMSPEQITDSHTVDIRADLYSLGCVFYFLLSGSVPFPEGSFVERLLKHRSQPPLPIDRFRTDVPTEVVGIICRLLGKNPDTRYQTPADLVSVLERLALPGATPTRWIPPAQSTMDTESYQPTTESTPFGNLQDPVKESAERSGWFPELSPNMVVLFVAVLIGVGLAVVGYNFSKSNPPSANQPETPRPKSTHFELWEQYVAKLSVNDRSNSVIHELAKQNSWFPKEGVETTLENDKVKGLVLPPVYVADLSFLRAFGELEQLEYPAFVLSEHVPMLRTIDSLKTINGKAIGEYCALHDGFEQWKSGIASLSAEQQVEAVNEMLGKFNPDFTGKIFYDNQKAIEWRNTPEYDPKSKGSLFVGRPVDGKVVRLHIDTDAITDLLPIRALPHLQAFTCRGSATSATGRLSSVKALAGTTIEDLTICNTALFDIEPLRDLPLTDLIVSFTRVSDLSPLVGKQFNKLYFQGSRVRNVTPLKRIGVKILYGYFDKQRDLPILRGMKGVTSIDGVSAEEYLR